MAEWLIEVGGADPGPPAGVHHQIEVTDGLALGDSIEKAVVYNRVFTDGLATRDSVAVDETAGTAHARTVTDQLGLSDSVIVDLQPGAGSAIYDDFERADSTTSLGSTPTGQAWRIDQTGLVCGISAGRARAYAFSGDADEFATIPLGTADGRVAAKLVALGEWCGVCHRYSSPNNAVKFYANVAGGFYQIERKSGGVSFWDHGQVSVVPQAGDVVAIIASGSTLLFHVERNGVVVGSKQVSDSTLGTNTRGGLIFGAELTVRFDDFEGPNQSPPVAPDAPTIGTASAGNQQITVPFTPGGDGGSPTTGYRVELENLTTAAVTTHDVAASPAVLGNLVNGENYRARVKHLTEAFPDGGDFSAWSNTVTPFVSQGTGATFVRPFYAGAWPKRLLADQDPSYSSPPAISTLNTNHLTFSHQLDQSAAGDPELKLYQWRNWQDTSQGAFLKETTRRPPGAVPDPEGDAHFHVADPQPGDPNAPWWAYETWWSQWYNPSGTSPDRGTISPTPTGALVCGRVERIDLRGNATEAGTRAAGVPAITGLIRAAELAQAVAGEIEDFGHVIALAVHWTWRYPGMEMPADEQDWYGYLDCNHPDNLYSCDPSMYRMGSRIAIDPAVNVEALGLPNGVALRRARTLQRYGGIILDTSGNFNDYVERSAPTAHVDLYRAGATLLTPHFRRVVVPWTGP